MLKVSEIEVRYGGAPVIHNVSLEVNRGELVSVVGSNGAGKSTLLRTIAGALHPSKGSVQFEGQEISHLATPDIVRRGITYVPEARLIFGPLTVEENLELGAYTVSDPEEVKRNMGSVYDLFPRLAERRRQLGGTLSGGEQQMLAIGRGLMSSPKLLMLDEPSLGLMPKLVDEMLEAVAKLKTTGKTILLVEQKVRESLELSDRGYILQTGRTVHQGTGKDLLKTEAIQKAFLGL
ncbi:MAG: branched-chain amino acid ABC transporter ATP-binding protein [Deltaproteobacteria bacterium RBG_13_52_11b]|nr:MAG: branched-chain amino acid ABC transporter ATP-binding protein [Deltaproteobacteria bacterium RBG_13_52_11b]